MLSGKNPLSAKDFSDVKGQVRHGPFETSRRNVIVGGAAMVAAFGLPIGLRYRTARRVLARLAAQC